MAWLAMVWLLQTAQPLVADPANIDDAGTITVTATRPSDLAAAAADCEKNRCPTRKDVAVTVSYASALFDAGDYREARRLLAAAVGRTKDAGRQEPLAVSQLYAAQAALSMHDGDQNTTREAVWASRNVLSDAPGVAALPRLTAEFRLADWQYRVGDNAGAAARYARIITDANANAQPSIADVASLRRAITLNALGRRTESVALLEELAARADPDSAAVRRAALATAARQAFQAGDTAGSDGFASRLAASAAATEPLLVSAPPMPRPGVLANNKFDPMIGMDRGARGADVFGLRWVDIGFWIKPDGRVEDVGILRGSAQLGWAQPLLGYLGGRRYSPFAERAADSIGRYRVERYTLTADYVVPIGSLIRRRGRNPRFEMMEMTAAPPAVATQ